MTGGLCTLLTKCMPPTNRGDVDAYLTQALPMNLAANWPELSNKKLLLEA